MAVNTDRKPFCNFVLAGVSLTDYGLEVPSPFCNLELTNSEITSMTSWVLTVIVGGDATRKANVSAFEALLYSAAQSASKYPTASGIPVSFLMGWLDRNGNINDYLSYQGFTLKFSVSTNGLYMQYRIEGFASLAMQTSIPTLRIPELSGFVQPSAVLVGLARSTKITSYYELDIDRNDAPTMINHGPLTTSFNRYVRGTWSAEDDFDTFPGLLPLSKSFSTTRDSAGLRGVRRLSQAVNNRIVSPLGNFLRQSNTDTTPQISTFSYWVDEPTMTRPGIIHYKSNAGLTSSQSTEILEFGTRNTNVLSISGNYDGVAYNLQDMAITQLGFVVDGSGNTIAQGYEVVNSWSSTLFDVFQTANIINSVNALSTQFAGNFQVTIPGSLKVYNIAQPVNLLVLTGGTLSPVSGMYSIMSVTHNVSHLFTTTLRIQRLVSSAANQVAASAGIFIQGSARLPQSSFSTTPNVVTPYLVNFGTMFPTMEHMTGAIH